MKILKSEFISEDLRNRIYSGEFNATHRLPSENDLSVYYGCSRPTLRKALDSLEACHLITRRQGLGSFLTAEGLQPFSKKITSDGAPALFGLVFPGLGANYVFDLICSELARILAQHDCSLVWGGNVQPKSKTLMDDVKQICSKYLELKVDGVFFSPIEYTPLRDEINNYILHIFEDAHIPVVLIDSDVVDFPQRSAHDLVSIDHIQSSYQVVHHMLEQQNNEIHFISPPMSNRTIKLRQIGFREALYDKNIHVDRELVHEGDPGDIDFVKSILDRGSKGILCSNDGTAVKLLQTLHILHVKVPKDLIVAGFDNLSYLSQIRTPLTSIAQPIEMISQEAVQIMLDRIKEPHRLYKTVRYPGVLICRRSTNFGAEQE